MRTLEGCGLGPYLLLYIEYTTIRATTAIKHYKSYVLEVLAIRREKYKEVDLYPSCVFQGKRLCRMSYHIFRLNPLQALSANVIYLNIILIYKKPLWEFLDAAPTYWRYLEILSIRVMKKLTEMCFGLMLAHCERPPELNIMQYTVVESHLH